MKAFTDTIEAFLRQIDFKGLVNELEGTYSPNDIAFMQRIFSEGLCKYSNRLSNQGFVNNQRVLDAGCGFGQWSMSFSACSERIDCCDISSDRVAFLQKIADTCNVNNLYSKVSSLNELQYDDDLFDLVFCYGALFCTPWKETLKEFHRVCKKGGLVYVNANDWGWYQFVWDTEHNKVDGFDPKARVIECLQNTLNYERQNVFNDGIQTLITENELEKKSIECGFEVLYMGPEGTYPPNKASMSFLKNEYQGSLAVYEAVLRKV